MSVCVSVFCSLLFSKMKNWKKIQRFSRQLHKIKFEPFSCFFLTFFSLSSTCNWDRNKKFIAGLKKTYTFNYQLSNNYLDEEIRCVWVCFFSLVRCCVWFTSVLLLLLCIGTWYENEWIPKKCDVFGQKQNKCSTHNYLTGGHTRICDAMRWKEKVNG